MPTGDDFQDNTPAPNPAPKKRFHYPPPDGTGVIAWTAGETFAQAIASGIPGAIRNKVLSKDAKITIVLDVEEV